MCNDVTIGLRNVGPQSNALIARFLPLQRSLHCIGDLHSIDHIERCDKEDIKTQLIAVSNENEDDIIIIMGETSVYSTLSNIANEAIQEVMDNNNPKSVNLLISKLMKKLTNLFNRFICGVRNQTLIINTCGPYTTSILGLKKNHMLIRQIMYVIITGNKLEKVKKQYYGIKNYSSDESCFDDNIDKVTSYNTKQYYDYENYSSGEISSDDDTDKKDKSDIENRIYKKQEQSGVTSVDKALNIIRITVRADKCTKEEYVKINDAYGRILAKNVYSLRNVPHCKISTIHGYALLASEKETRKVLKTVDTPDKMLVEPDTCVRVDSGDPIPKGANAVVKPENVKILGECVYTDYFSENDLEYEIRISINPEINENIRNIGCEIKCHQLVFRKFTRIGTAELSILTLCNLDSVPVIELPSIGLLSISNESKGFENTLGRPYADSNRIFLTSLLKENRYDSIDFGTSAYKLNDIVKKIEASLDEVDLLVITGHSNDKDILKPILKEYFNAIIYFSCLDMKPGKSTTFASCIYKNKKKYFLCMSANPTTVPIIAHVLLLPLLNEMHCNFLTKSIVLHTCVENHDLHVRPKYSWATVQWEKKETFPRAHCSESQHRNIIKYQKANALLMLPKHTSEMPELHSAFVQAMFFVQQSDDNRPSNDEVTNCIDELGGHVALLKYLKYDKKAIEAELIAVGKRFRGSVIILIGQSSSRNLAKVRIKKSALISSNIHEAIKKVINDQISSDMNKLILDLTQGLKLIERPICGILESNLVINVFGSYTNVEPILTINGSLILDILVLTKQDYNIPEAGSFCDIAMADNSSESLKVMPDPPDISFENFDKSSYDNSKDDNADQSLKNNNNDNNKDNDNNDNNSGESMDIDDDAFEEQTEFTDEGSYEKYELVSLEEARNIMLKVINKDYEECEDNEQCKETVQMKDAYGRVVVDDVRSSVNVPPCRISAKHGYAVVASDGQAVRKVLKANLELTEDISVVPGTCVRVRSGDPVPNGATAVVMSANTKIIEESDNDDDYFNIDSKEYEIEVLVTPKDDENIRNAGCEIQTDDVIIKSHKRIEAAELGILTLCNIDSIKVFKLPSVGILSIRGYESEPTNLKYIYDCNKVVVSSLLKNNGCNPVDFEISRNQLFTIYDKIKDALNQVDLLVIIGQANDRDTVKPALTDKTEINATIHFGGVNIKPGKSTTFATCEFNEKKKYFLCMSANPATVTTVTHVLLLPLLETLQHNVDNDHVKIQTWIKTDYKLHTRPRLSFTFLQWLEKELITYPSAHNVDVENQYMMQYQLSNALLMLPKHTSNVPELKADSRFLPAIFIRH
ncbi:PREDICTED: uncharacterized protein LOC108776938 [Cyphomyrmex costatus]|uniref:uncharacterized protein LOC108776938 n=1 Tax=Cyphomyrmex costatus TaxID=456900 RepID=UPI0008522639|nr:PREDICTED: uncharacterized protein LOC108776938 [Cyphomyrmex costatus]